MAFAAVAALALVITLPATPATPAGPAPAGPAAALLAQASPAPASLAPASPTPATPASAGPVADDTRAPSRKTYAVPPSLGRAGRTPAVPRDTPPAGTKREWPALDDTEGRFYRKSWTLRAVGTHIEVWVADDLAFPDGDCRGAGATRITDAQIAGLVHQFDTVIHPRETAAFSTPPERDGTDPVLDGDFTGGGGRTVTLVDNVRDANFHDIPPAQTYIAGFFSPQLDNLVDRNVMPVDAYD